MLLKSTLRALERTYWGVTPESVSPPRRGIVPAVRSILRIAEISNLGKNSESNAPGILGRSG